MSRSFKGLTSMVEYTYDVMIAGTGPAGLTAAMYAQRLGLRAVDFGDIPGGNTTMIGELLNYPGFVGGVGGAQFGVSLFQQAQKEGVSFPMTRLDKVIHQNSIFSGIDKNGHTFNAATAIIATGRIPKRLPVQNAHLKGIYFCSLRDGPLFRGKHATLAVVGNNNAAGQHALTLAKIADKVILIEESENLKMDKAFENLIDRRKNIEILLNTEVVGYDGPDFIDTISVSNRELGIMELPVDGVFLAVGWRPNTKILEIEVAMTADGYIKTDERLMTSFPGLFAAGDVRDTDMWQVLTACADGARAAKYALEFLEMNIK